MSFIEGISDWSGKEMEFAKLRAETLNGHLSDYVDQFAVTAKRQTMCHIMSRIELFKKILDVQGAVIECGVYRGQGLMTFYHLSSILEPYAFTRKIYGFDSFAGMQSVSDKDPLHVDGLLGDVDYDFLEKMIDVHDRNRPLSHIPKCELIKGDATITIPTFTKEHPELIVALLSLDFDIYAPTKTALEYFLPLIPKGGLVVFDELNVAKWAGETAALKELIDINKVEIKKFPYNPYVSYFVV